MSDATRVILAFAWVTDSGQRWDTIQSHLGKVEKAIIGTAFAHISPTALNSFQSQGILRIMTDPQHLFHPKLALFYMGVKVKTLLGSSNLTAQGFGLNHELNIFMEDTLRVHHFAIYWNS
jgi:phosphatidylserine/phosphatidylglycerophosphate/cardiolipin synthase-like enzyme